jgi:hypothetical protein
VYPAMPPPPVFCKQNPCFLEFTGMVALQNRENNEVLCKIVQGKELGVLSASVGSFRHEEEVRGRDESLAQSLVSTIRGASVRSAPPGRMILSLPHPQGCASLARGYFRWLPTGAGQWSVLGMPDARGYLELLSWIIVRRSEEIICKHPRYGGRVLRMGFVGLYP